MIGQRLKNLSIRNKLILIVLITTAVILGLAGASYFTSELLTMRRDLLRQLSMMGRILGANSTAALVFNDPAAAEETLSALQTESHITAAATYDQKGRLFAAYFRKEAKGAVALPPRPGIESRFRLDALEIFHPIEHEREKIGTLYIRSDTTELMSRMKRSILITLVALLLGLLLVYFLATKLQRIISGPLARLAETARQVAVEKNYALRASKEGEDEVGRLIDVFNEMLEQIQSQNEELRHSHDVLERRVAERTEALARSNRELEQFAYVASHDLQEPLRKITAFGDRLKEESHASLNETARDYLDRMEKAAARMKDLITGLLLYSRVATQAQPFEPVPLEAVIREVLGDIEQRLNETGGTVEMADLPTVNADRLQMRQLFQNLIANGLKFHRPGEVPRIKIKGKTLPGGSVEITVADNGIGFEEKYADRIFRPFQRLHTREEFEGTGMGLAICQKIVEMHGGSITAKSVPGRGSQFIIVFAPPKG